MIIAIDETGDFSSKSELKSFFVAVLLQQQNGKLALKKQQYELWLETIPKEKFNSKNEIKGSDLNEEELFQFTEMVYTKEPCIINQVVYFSPSENPEELMKSIKKTEVESIQKLVDLAKEKNKPHWEKFYKKLSIWHKNAKKMNYQHFMKLILLRRLINQTFENAIGISIILEMVEDSDSFNLLNLKYKIDKDFIKGQEANQFWKELLRNSFQSFNEKNPLPALDEWQEKGHPFLEKYKGKSETVLFFTELFRENCDFLESDENWEIQIADITGIIFNRYFNKNKAQKAFENLNKCVSNQNITELKLSNTTDVLTESNSL
ncbi:hypothetical protein GCM10022393_42840 [Aquimarina addita]|uniref:DUF3800 domain-containing protein n=1 Tax=Aquimarina addita TaxID=870485 RepID=A0ABP6UVG6_9FLAO